jgi:hypothetical protein
MPLKHISCASSSNPGEILARNYLMAKLAESEGILLTNYHHPLNNGTQEHDLVLINEQGVWTLEVKNWHGPIEADQVYWMSNNGYRTASPITSIEIKAKLLATRLEKAGFENVSVVGMVVLTQPRVTTPLNIRDPREHKVFHLTPSLISAVTGTKYLYDRKHNQRLSPALIKEIADMLVPRLVDPEQKIIHGYQLVRDLGAGEMFHVYEARHITIPERRARAKKYSLPTITSTKEFKEAVRRFKQDMLALTKVENDRNVVRVYDYQQDPDSNDIYWLMLEWVKGITLQDRLDYEMPIEFDEQRHILLSLASALESCHNKGILHRNLNPSSIYLAVDGTIKLGDFDYAHIAGITRTISRTGAQFPVNRYTAPELIESPRNAGVQSDLYALGALWYDMIVRPKTDEPILISLLKEIILPDNARELLGQLLKPRMEDRPNSAKEVRDRLRKL